MVSKDTRVFVPSREMRGVNGVWFPRGALTRVSASAQKETAELLALAISAIQRRAKLPLNCS